MVRIRNASLRCMSTLNMFSWRNMKISTVFGSEKCHLKICILPVVACIFYYRLEMMKFKKDLMLLICIPSLFGGLC